MTHWPFRAAHQIVARDAREAEPVLPLVDVENDVLQLAETIESMTGL